MAEKFNFTKQGIEALPVPEKRTRYQDAQNKYRFMTSYEPRKIIADIASINIVPVTPAMIETYPDLAGKERVPEYEIREYIKLNSAVGYVRAVSASTHARIRSSDRTINPQLRNLG